MMMNSHRTPESRLKVNPGTAVLMIVHLHTLRAHINEEPVGACRLPMALAPTILIVKLLLQTVWTANKMYDVLLISVPQGLQKVFAPCFRLVAQMVNQYSISVDRGLLNF